VTLPREWGRHCSTEYCTLNIPPEEPTLRGMGGGTGGVHRGSHRPSTALHVAYPTLHKHSTARPLSPPKNPPFCGMGGGGGTGGVHRVVAQARHCT